MACHINDKNGKPIKLLDLNMFDQSVVRSRRENFRLKEHMIQNPHRIVLEF
jgi:hypothetical protein